jgi:hypothetical protein
MQSFECSIPILINNEVNPIFIRATSFLLNEFSKEFPSVNVNHTELKTKLKDLWKSEYSASLIENSDSKIWTDIYFNTLQDKLVFLLKHGSL